MVRSERAIPLLTFGSARQAGELREAANRIGHRLEFTHVAEDVADWVPRPVEDMLTDARKALAEMPPPRAMVNFGRATVPDGIRRIAETQERLRADGDVPARTEIIGPSEAAARTWGDKSLIAKALTKLGLPMPATLDVDSCSVDRVSRAVERGELSLPLVVKVVHLTGGAGMRYVPDLGALPGVVAELSADGSRLVASEFVSGDEVSVDILRLGGRTLVYPPGFKRHTDSALTHADHKIKVNGVAGGVGALTRDVTAIAEHFDLNGFFSLEGVITSAEPPAWKILEGATRVTNNIQMQDGSLGFDSLAAVVRHLAGELWWPRPCPPRLALSLPIYRHRGADSLRELRAHAWVRQAKLEDLALMPGSTDDRLRLTVKMVAEDLEAQLRILAEATGDACLPSRVLAEIARVRRHYGD